ncbi:TetM/TetW/TetO/TetS family tetracycline resistance ribosomal protection protein, partial [bacterium]|nr:TetM/TetW/TetO/TetS family tetracycline resistance ribosomal protection protein [bacterium]
IHSDWNSEKMALPLMELLAERDDTLLNHFLEQETLPFDQAQFFCNTLVQKGQLYPILFGAAKFSIGISELLDTAITALAPISAAPETGLSARIFKAEYHRQLGRVLYARLYQGTLEARQSLKHPNLPKTDESGTDKIAQVWTIRQGRFENTGSAGPGEIAMLTGLSHFQIGHTLGTGDNLKNVRLAAPLLTVQVFPATPAELPALLAALNQLADEDPHLNLEWNPEMREVHIKIMGNIQLEILDATLQYRFDLAVSFGKPAVIYKETPAKPMEGYESYTMPKPCWAIVRFQIDPGESGSGIHFESDVGVNHIAQRYQNEIARFIPETLKQGPKGWAVTDIRIRLIAGEHHTVHSRPGDFKIATAIALMKGLTSGGT